MKNIIWGILFLCFVLDILRNQFDNKKEYNSTEKKENEINTKLNVSDHHSNNLPEKNLIEQESYNQDKKDNAGDELDNNSINQASSQSSEKIIINIKYCTTLYSKQYEELKKELLGNYSNIEVNWSQYPISPTKAYLSKAAWILQMAMMIIIMGGDSIKNYLTFIPSHIMELIKKNKFMVGIANYLIWGWVSNQLNTSGAFEVYFEGEKIWSKLDMRVLPSALKIGEILTKKGLYLE